MGGIILFGGGWAMGLLGVWGMGDGVGWVEFKLFGYYRGIWVDENLGLEGSVVSWCFGVGC